MHKSVDKELLLKYLKIIGNGYATGDFKELYPFLAPDCVWESQWRLTPETGKETVINYFNKKGDILRETASFPKWMVVEFVDNLNPIKASIVKRNVKNPPVSIGLLYEKGKLALFMAQDLDDRVSSSIVDIKIDENNLIKRIDMCMPELFKFVKYEPDTKC